MLLVEEVAFCPQVDKPSTSVTDTHWLCDARPSVTSTVAECHFTPRRPVTEA